MRPLTLEEFAQDMRVRGDIRQADMADEILALIDIEEEVAEPYGDLCADLEHYAKAGGFDHADNPPKACEWLGDRSNTLKEIEEAMEKAGRPGDVDDAVKELIDEFENVETAMRKHGGWTEGDLQDALFALIERAERAPEEIEVLTYDL